MDWQANLYDPTYDVLGIDAEIQPGPDSTADAVTVRVISKIEGIEVPGVAVGLETLKPGAVVRVKELTAAGLSRADLRGGSLDMGDAGTWNIEATLPRPSPKGEGDGELLLILSEA